MQRNADAILKAAAELPESERLELIARLYSTFADEGLTLSLDDQGLRNEIERRFADSSDTIPWSGLRAEG